MRPSTTLNNHHYGRRKDSSPRIISPISSSPALHSLYFLLQLMMMSLTNPPFPPPKKEFSMAVVQWSNFFFKIVCLRKENALILASNTARIKRRSKTLTISSSYLYVACFLSFLQFSSFPERSCISFFPAFGSHLHPSPSFLCLSFLTVICFCLSF